MRRSGWRTRLICTSLSDPVHFALDGIGIAMDMDHDEWCRLQSSIKERFYDVLVSTANCGPFDGGCVSVANALQQVLGGNVVVLHRADGIADHAALFQDGLLWDHDGPASPSEFLARFNRAERAYCVGYRAVHALDIPDAYRDPAGYS